MSLRPIPTAVRPYQFPRVERATLANGLNVQVVPMHRLPIVTVLALVNVGASADARGQEGLAALTARTLDEGTAALDGAALTERFEALGASFEASADWDSTVARVTVTPRHLDEAVSLFAEVLRTPLFPAADVEREREERIDALAQALAEPRGLADMRFTGLLYAGARYGRPAGGSARSVATLSAEQLRAFHAAHYGPRTTTLIVVGDITLDAAMRLAEAKFGDWQSVANHLEHPRQCKRDHLHKLIRFAGRLPLGEPRGQKQVNLLVGEPGGGKNACQRHHLFGGASRLLEQLALGASNRLFVGL